jgi:hypothetical protein
MLRGFDDASIMRCFALAPRTSSDDGYASKERGYHRKKQMEIWPGPGTANPGKESLLCSHREAAGSWVAIKMGRLRAAS